MRKILAAAALCSAAITPANAEDDCRLVQMAAVDLGTDSSGRVYVPMSISGQNVKLMIDTGNIFSMLSEESTRRLGLKVLPAFSTGLMMYGGVRIRQYTEAHDVVFGGLKAASMPMQILPEGNMSSEVDGLLGPNILRSYDDDFDFANAKFRLFSPEHCEGKVVYWTTEPYAKIPIVTDREGHIEISVQLDGKDIKAVIDTGAWRSVMSLEAAKRIFHIAERDAQLTPVKGAISGRDMHYPFAKLSLHEVTVNNPDLVLIPDEESHFWTSPTPIILGMGILRQLHIYIAYREKKLYVTAASAH